METFRADVRQHAVIVENGVGWVLFSGRVSVEDARDIKEIVLGL